MKRNDQVFQLSLTEIAFIIVFLLLLLLGWMVHHTEREQSRILAEVKKTADASAAVAAAQRANAQLAELLKSAGTADPASLITQLVNREKLTAEEAALRERIDALDRTVSALVRAKEGIEARDGLGEKSEAESLSRTVSTGLMLTEAIRRHMAQPGTGTASSADGQHLTQEQILREAQSALALKAAIASQLAKTSGRTLETGKESELASELVSTAVTSEGNAGRQALASAQTETKDLRGQVAYLKSRLGAKGGRDYPPCWAEEGTGKLQYLFTIDIQNDGLLIREAWPPARAADAKRLPGIETLLSRSPLMVADFTERMHGIDHASKVKNCRHYVLLRNHVKDLRLFNAFRYAVESYFYKLEVRS